MTAPLARDVYHPAAVAACEKALRTILARVGPWGDRVILVGGLVPRYLIPHPPIGVRPHAGTTDLDIVVGIAMADDESAVYRTLQNNLRDAGFAPGRPDGGGGVETFRWVRVVDGVVVQLEFFCPATDGAPGSLRRNPGDKVGSEISAIRLRGAELVARDVVVRSLSGDMLDKGGVRDGIPIYVANLLPFLMLKGFAIADRHKDKDAYDIVWVLTAYDGGPAAAAAAARTSPIASSADVRDALAGLATAFATVDHDGPALYARYVLGLEGRRPTSAADEAARLRRDAHGTVQAFLAVWDRSV